MTKPARRGRITGDLQAGRSKSVQNVILPTPDARGEHYGRLFRWNSMAYLVLHEFY